MKKLYVCFTYFFLFFFKGAIAQTGSITGQVVDSLGSPIDLANVGLVGTNKGAVTNQNGSFIIRDVKPGEYELRSTCIGYGAVVEMIRIASDEDLNVHIVLGEDHVFLQPIEIIGRQERGYKNSISFSGTKSASLVRDIPQTINVVTKELALDQAAFTVNDVVKNISGVNQFSLYNDISVRGFRIQGQRNSGNLLNGMRAFTSFWKQQLIPHIERVEVIKGPSSALFGNASPGGTINRVTKKPLMESRQSITTSVGSFNTIRLLTDFTGPMNSDQTLLYRLNIGYENTDGFRDLQFGKNLVMAPSFSFLPTNRTRLNFDLVYQDSKGRLDRGQAAFGNRDLNSTPISTSLSAANDFLNEINVSATVSLQHQFGDRLSFNSSFMRSVYDEDLLEHRTSNQFARMGDGTIDESKVAMRVFIRKRSWNNNSFNNYLNYTYPLGSLENTLLVGYDYFEQRLEPGGSQLEARSYLLANGRATNNYNPDNASAYILDDKGNPVTNVAHFDLTSPTANSLRDMSDYVYRKRTFNQFLQRSHGIYLQNQSTMGPIKLLLGIRKEFFLDYLNFNTSEEVREEQDILLPRVGLVYSLTPSFNVYGTWVQGYQPQNAATIANPDAGGPFDPLTSELFEVGAKTEWFNGRLGTNVAIYHLTQQNGLFPANDPENPDRLEQLGEERSQGVELDMIGNLSLNWSVVLGYGFNDAQITRSDDEAELNRQKPNAPKHTFNFWSKYLIGSGTYEGLGIGLGYNYVSERNGSIISSTSGEPDVFPSYGIVDAALFYTLNKVQLQLNINNILDETHWVGGYDVIRAFPGAPRNFNLSISYTF